MDKEQQNEYWTPRLMKDSSEVDGHAEAVMDYVLSWCLRWSETKFKDIKPTLHRYCQNMLFKLIEKNTHDNIIVENVDVWKQSQKIDLWVEAKLVVNGNEEWHSVLIENKSTLPYIFQQIQMERIEASWKFIRKNLKHIIQTDPIFIFTSLS